MCSDNCEPLGCGIRIFTDKIHRFGTDAVLLADFASVRAGDIACDLGTGCGIIPLLWSRHRQAKSVTAVDIQQSAVSLLERSVELNRLEDYIIPVCDDLRTLDRSKYNGKFTLVTMNPPYKRANGGAVSPTDGRAIARHEITCTLDDAVSCAARLLKPSGRLCMCHRPERLADLICSMRQNGIEPKRIRTVCQRAGDAPMLILCEGRKGGHAGVEVMPALVIEDETGGYSPEMLTVYADYTAAKEKEK